jgi:undecaprenyl-diphosphatase
MSGDGNDPVLPPSGAAEDSGVEPPEERLARRLDERAATGHPLAARTSGLLHRLGALDRTAYVAVARLSTPALDVPLSRLSHFANHSKPWFAVAGLLAAFGGPTGRRAALTGVAAIGAASLVVNQPMKLAGNRARPDRAGHEVPEARWVTMPTSTSFPSGHSASALAFAVAVGDVVPALRWPLRAAGSTVAFSRVYTGVHYPGDVLVGAATGAVLGRLVSRLGERVAQR